MAEKQDFHGGVGQAADSITNQNVHFNIQPAIDETLLVPAQREQLKALVIQICEEFGDHEWDVWRLLHARVGVTTVREIKRTQFADAETALRNHLKQRRDESSHRSLVGTILRVTREKSIQRELNNFCTRQFGERQLKALTREQLVKTQNFVLDFTNRPSPRPKRGLLALVLAYPWQFASVFLFGVILGRLW